MLNYDVLFFLKKKEKDKKPEQAVIISYLRLPMEIFKWDYVFRVYPHLVDSIIPKITKIILLPKTK